jgi:tetratricopeptide (TPR) repeat protein
MKRSFILLPLLLLSAWLIASSASAAEPAPGFEAANQLYEKGDFAAAAQAYAALTGQGPVSPAVWFNLGNAQFKAGHLGDAIAAYRRAEILAPRDPDIRANLQFARDKVMGDSLRRSRAEAWLTTLSLNEWATLTAVAWWTLFGLLTAARLRPTLAAALRLWTFLVAGAVFVIMVCLGLAWQANRPGTHAVVTVAEATVRNGPLDESKPAFSLRDGAEVQLLDAKDEWLRVGVSPSKTGWVKKSEISPILP